ncbi:hypothetical protein RvY_15670 [Ramazzottius varieornatus]|uniref:Reverse transcriptase domain-containing protein n=1 Tax=Ramazzottius varieornatus TaxID=947166 RepID=A0A1D1W2H0_RAMVA|nr:hypothetical protein RvY_15670 [Ramazzottius varieornatus]
MVAAVQSFPNGSAGGLDGLRPQHIKDMLAGASNGATVALAEALAKLMTQMLHGKVPDNVCEVLYGASLTALKKKDGGIRPIAVGNTLRRLAGKIIGKRIGSEMEQRVRPEKVGRGTTGGAEAAVHAVRSFLEEGRTASQILLKLNFKNAFNTIRRDVLIQNVHDNMPMYLPFTVMTEGLDLGLELNTSKCELFAFGGSHQDRVAIEQEVNVVCPGILLPSRSELSLLGAPSMEEGLEAVRAKTGPMKVVSKRLCLMHAHQALFLLKNCLCLPKLLYILRCSPVWKFAEVLKEFDEVIR